MLSGMKQEHQFSGHSFSQRCRSLSPQAWIGIVILLVIYCAGLAYSLKKDVSELPVYVLGAERMMAGEEIYRTDDIKPFTYPPFFALPQVPLVCLPDSLQRPAWFTMTYFSLVIIVAMLRRGLAPMLSPSPGSKSPPVWVFWLVVALIAGRHVSAVFENQSHDMLVFLAVMAAAAFSVQGADRRSGLFAGAGGACKATPALFLPVYLWQRRFRAAVFLGLGGAVLTLLPDLLFPRAEGGLWVMSWFETFVQGVRPGDTAHVEGTWNAWNKLNQNLSGTLYRLLTPVDDVNEHLFDVSLIAPSEPVRKGITMLAQLGVMSLLWLGTRFGLSRDESGSPLALRRLGEAGAVVCGMVLLSPMSSKSHFCVLLLPVAFCTAYLLYHKWDLFLALLLALVFAAGTLTSKGILGRELGNIVLARGTVTFCALAMLVACCYVLNRLGRSCEKPGSDSANIN
jgi:alpha-1,2-mannosyltransferase